jgi:hypothetical protein
VVIGVSNVEVVGNAPSGKMLCDRTHTRWFKEASLSTPTILMTSSSISQYRLAVASTRVNALDFVVITISHPEVILSIFNAQAML